MQVFNTTDLHSPLLERTVKGVEVTDSECAQLPTPEKRHIRQRREDPFAQRLLDVVRVFYVVAVCLEPTIPHVLCERGLRQRGAASAVVLFAFHLSRPRLSAVRALPAVERLGLPECFVG